MDGLEQQLDSVASNQYDELATSATANVTLWPRPLVVFGGAKAMSALTDDQVRVLREAARASAEPNVRFERRRRDRGSRPALSSRSAAARDRDAG